MMDESTLALFHKIHELDFVFYAALREDVECLADRGAIMEAN